jgi:hypothetical protein
MTSLTDKDLQKLWDANPLLSYDELISEFQRVSHQSGSGLWDSALNIYRKRACSGKSRMLMDGEKHLGCHNYTGPGTRIDLKEVQDYKPYNEIDNCSRNHDLDYLEADGMTDPVQKAHAIRIADEKAITCYDRYPNVSGYAQAKAGIRSKMHFEDNKHLRSAIKKVAPNYYGQLSY